MLDLSVIVISYNTRELLTRCLKSVVSTVHGTSYEIIVVDNASRDGSAEMVRRDFPRVSLICNDVNRGFAAANNQGIRASRGRYILLLNSDAMVMPGSIRSMVEYMDSHEEVGVVGPRLLNADGSFQGSCADFPSLRGEMLLLTKLSKIACPQTYPNYPPEQCRERRAVDWVSGACLMARRKAVDSVGLLDEDYFMYAEETDWCYRMREAGWHVHYLPSARVVHWSGQSAAQEPERKRSHLYGAKLLFMKKHRGPLVAAIFHLAIKLTAVAKLGLWAAVSLTPNRSHRRYARQQVRSYAMLMKEL
ncbi:MAG: glycosyltransferase family 2 protein [Chloroflexota bacterium]